MLLGRFPESLSWRNRQACYLCSNVSFRTSLSNAHFFSTLLPTELLSSLSDLSGFYFTFSFMLCSTAKQKANKNLMCARNLRSHRLCLQVTSFQLYFPTYLKRKANLDFIAGPKYDYHKYCSGNAGGDRGRG